MRIAGIQKLTLLDFPGKTAATVFAPGCNFRCPFCHNADLVVGAADAGAGAAGAQEGGKPPAGEAKAAGRAEGAIRTACPEYPLEDLFAFLEKRRGLLDGVCVTGGEPLLQPGIAGFCARIKDAGFAVKLDTNGSRPERLRSLLEAGLVDYVAMDVKNAPARYAETAGVPGLDLQPIRASMDLLLAGTVPYEFRTTVVRELHTEDDLLELARWIGGAAAWHLQSFEEAEGTDVIGGTGRLHAWDPEALRALLPSLQAIVPAAKLRGIA